MHSQKEANTKKVYGPEVHVSLFNAISLMIYWHYHKEILQFNQTTNSMEHSPKVSPSLEINLYFIEVKKFILMFMSAHQLPQT